MRSQGIAYMRGRAMRATRVDGAGRAIYGDNNSVTTKGFVTVGYTTLTEEGEAHIGWIGQLHPRLAKALDLHADVIAFELDLAPMLARNIPRAAGLSKSPSVRRDLAFVVPETVRWADVSATVKAAAGGFLRDLVLFDRYSGAGVESGFKSLAMGLILQDESRTLTDRDVEQVVADVVAALQQQHHAAIRS